MKRLFFVRAADGETPGGAPTPKKPAETPAAAEIVLTSDAKEADAAEIVRLNRELQDRDGKLKARETRIAELEDQNRALKEPQKIPVTKASETKKNFLNGWPFN